METFEFQAETKQLLDLMIHSIYSNKDIFLRELISNGSDALDRLRFEALTNDDYAELVKDQHIRLERDPAARTLTVSDNGIGMSRQEVIDYIGTIAKSGTKEFLKLLQEKQADSLPPELIGQFGVGLYASFMVADKIVLVTRRAGEETGTRWESSGDGTYTLDEVDADAVGTTIVLQLKPADTEDELHDYCEEWKLREIVGKYSDYVAYPIRMRTERKEIERDDEGKPKEGAEEQTVVTDQTLNSMQAIWTRNPADVKDEEYNEFYKHISHDWTAPLQRATLKAEGTFEFRALLFIPSQAPFDLFMREAQRGIHLYIKRVFIMGDCKELIPEYLRFVRGVVDSEDLSLNISREILQQNRQIQIMRKSLVGKLLGTLKDLQEKDNEKYLKFWEQFGRVLKEGLFQDHDNREKLLDLALFASTHSPDQLTTLAQYVERMKEGQEAIYYATGESRKAVENSPHLEAFKDKGYEVLLLTDPVDEVWVQSAFEYQEKPLKAVGKGAVELGTEDEKKKSQEERAEQEKDFKSLLECLKGSLEEHVKEVRLSNRLTSSPVCLVGEASDMTPQLEQLLRATGQDVPKIKRILEVNPAHPILEALQKRFTENKDDPVVAEYAELLHGQALLAEGGQPPDAANFSKKMADLMTRAL